MLPFLAGLAVGTALTILYAKRDEVKKAFNSPEFQGKVEEAKRASKRTFDDVKDKVGSLGLADKAKEIFANLKGEKSSKKASVAKADEKPKRGRKAGAKSGTTTAKTTTRAKKATSETTKTARAKKTTATKTTRAKRNTATKASGAKRGRKPASTTNASATDTASANLGANSANSGGNLF